MNPFGYPPQSSQRKHGPQGYADVESYRPWLRDEFRFRCVYCLDREQWRKLRGSFHLDHFLPQAFLPEAALCYDNLLYACASCNSLKGAQRIPAPETTLIANAVQVNPDGSINARTRAAKRLIRILRLDDPEYTEFRRVWIDILALAEQHDRPHFLRLTSYPEDLPDLASLQPPAGNDRPDGIKQCCHSLRQAGLLPDSY